MSFSGKKFKRVRAEGVEELAAMQNLSHIVPQLLSEDPVFSFTKVDDETFTFLLQFGSRSITNTFKIGEETETVRRDGSKVKLTYQLENDNVLKQKITSSDGKVFYFRREFSGDTCVLTITVDNYDGAGKIYYETVE